MSWLKLADELNDRVVGIVGTATDEVLTNVHAWMEAILTLERDVDQPPPPIVIGEPLMAHLARREARLIELGLGDHRPALRALLPQLRAIQAAQATEHALEETLGCRTCRFHYGSWERTHGAIPQEPLCTVYVEIPTIAACENRVETKFCEHCGVPIRLRPHELPECVRCQEA